jgi:hypothetical protein
MVLAAIAAAAQVGDWPLPGSPAIQQTMEMASNEL